MMEGRRNGERKSNIHEVVQTTSRENEGSAEKQSEETDRGSKINNRNGNRRSYKLLIARPFQAAKTSIPKSPVKTMMDK